MRQIRTYKKAKITKKDKRRNKIALIFLLIIICLTSLYFIIKSFNKEESPKQTRDYFTTAYAPGTFEVDGKQYTQNQEVVNLLLVGTNEDDAEYILLVIVDKENKTLLPIHIPRDTVCKYYVLDQFGKIEDTQTGHLEKSFGNGTRDMKSLNNVKNTVEKIFCNIRIEYSMMVDLNDVDKIANEFGPVYFNALDSYNDNGIVINKNDKVTIDSNNAVALIRGDDTKEEIKVIERRQNLYVDSLYSNCRENYLSNNAYFIQKFANLAEQVTFSSNDILNLLAEVNGYTKKDLISLIGTREKEGYFLDEKQLESICLDYIYNE